MFVDQHVVNPGTKTTDVARIEGELKVLAARDLQLWSIVILTMLLFAGGFMSFVLPNVAWGHEVELWNLNTKLRCELSFNWAVSAYMTGETPQDLLGRVERSLSSKKSGVPFLAEITHAKQDAERLHDDHRTRIGSK